MGWLTAEHGGGLRERRDRIDFNAIDNGGFSGVFFRK